MTCQLYRGEPGSHPQPETTGDCKTVSSKRALRPPLSVTRELVRNAPTRAPSDTAARQDPQAAERTAGWGEQAGEGASRGWAQEHSEGCRGARRGAGALGQQAAPGLGAHWFRGSSALCPRRSWEEILTNMILLLSDFHSVESARFF